MVHRVNIKQQQGVKCLGWYRAETCVLLLYQEICPVLSLAQVRKMRVRRTITVARKVGNSAFESPQYFQLNACWLSGSPWILILALPPTN